MIYNKMKTINEYLISKTHHSKTFSDKFPDGFCLVIPFGNAYDVLFDTYYDVMIENKYGGEPNAFLLKREDAVDYFDDKDVIVYKIPNHFKTIEALETGYRNGHSSVSQDNLEEIKTIDELFS